MGCVVYIDPRELQETLVEHEVVQQVRGSFLLRGVTNIQGEILSADACDIRAAQEGG